MTNVQVKICCLIMIAAVGCIIAWSTNAVISQSNNSIISDNKTAFIVERTNQASTNTKVFGSVLPVRYNGEDLEQFTLSQPLPDIWLVPENDNTNAAGEMKIALSAQARQILYQHWLKMLRHQYLTEVEETSKDINYQKEDVLLIQSTFDTKNELLNTPVNDEAVSRSFSNEESRELVIFIRDTSDEVIKEIKKIKNQN